MSERFLRADFVSQDRLRASADGTSFVVQTWSTPLLGHEERDGRWVLVDGEARWSAPPPEGPFTYVELHFDHIAYNVDHLNPLSGERDPLRPPVPTAMS
ncbi:MAG: DUF6544 family protein [Humibacillus sp.]